MDIEKTPKTQPGPEEAVPIEAKTLSTEYDVANQILADAAEYAYENFTEEEDRKLRWKIDWHLIPVVISHMLSLASAYRLYRHVPSSR